MSAVSSILGKTWKEDVKHLGEYKYVVSRRKHIQLCYCVHLQLAWFFFCCNKMKLDTNWRIFLPGVYWRLFQAIFHLVCSKNFNLKCSLFPSDICFSIKRGKQILLNLLLPVFIQSQILFILPSRADLETTPIIYVTSFHWEIDPIGNQFFPRSSIDVSEISVVLIRLVLNFL
jgi:hypothetical protein